MILSSTAEVTKYDTVEQIISWLMKVKVSLLTSKYESYSGSEPPFPSLESLKEHGHNAAHGFRQTANRISCMRVKLGEASREYQQRQTTVDGIDILS